ncbi:MAG: phosphocholine cytidylyltransferase family protein [Candidatus Neomarinimicrobiota bacterium]
MKAIILAAGVSRRLYPLTYDTPKCLIKVGSRAIIDYQMKALTAEGIKEVIVVVGYFREAVKTHLEKTWPAINFTFLINEHFFETNTAFSLNLCTPALGRTEILLMNGDVLYPKMVLKRIINSEHDSVLAVDIKNCGREEVKVIEGQANRIVAIGKELIEDNSLGEFIGVAKFSINFTRLLFDSLKRLISGGGKSDYFEAAIHPLLADIELYYEDVSDLPCIEIDFMEDLKQARELVKSELFYEK